MHSECQYSECEYSLFINSLMTKLQIEDRQNKTNYSVPFEGNSTLLQRKVCVCPCIAHASNVSVHTCDLCAQSADQRNFGHFKHVSDTHTACPNNSYALLDLDPHAIFRANGSLGKHGVPGQTKTSVHGCPYTCGVSLSINNSKS